MRLNMLDKIYHEPPQQFLICLPASLLTPFPHSPHRSWNNLLTLPICVSLPSYTPWPAWHCPNPLPTPCSSAPEPCVICPCPLLQPHLASFPQLPRFLHHTKLFSSLGTLPSAEKAFFPTTHLTSNFFSCRSQQSQSLPDHPSLRRISPPAPCSSHLISFFTVITFLAIHADPFNIRLQTEVTP